MKKQFRLGWRTLTLLCASLAIVSGCDFFKTDSSRLLDPSKLIKPPDASQINPILSTASPADTTQEVVPNATPPTPSDWEYSERDYVIGAMDILDISIMDLYAAGLETIIRRQVSASGYIDLPLLPRNIKAEGFTAIGLKDEIAAAYSPDILREPVVSVMVVVPRQNVFSVLGAVARPSAYSITRKEMRLLEALATAGGLTQSNIRYIYVFRQPLPRAAARPELPPTPVPTAPVELPPLPEIPDLRPIEPAPPTGPGGLEGQFRQLNQTPSTEPAPGAMSLTETASTGLEAPPAAPRMPKIIYSGGEYIVLEEEAPLATQPSGEDTPPVRPALRERAEEPIERQPRVYDPFGWELPGGAEGSRIVAINLKRLQEGDPRMNVVIRENDVVYVPTLEVGEFYIGGEVLRPGVYALTGRKVTVKMAMVAAGGSGPLGWPSKSILVRRIGDSQEQIIPLDIEAIFRGRAPDLFLKPDDVIAIGSDIRVSFYAVIRNAFRMTYGFGFIYDRNFANPYVGGLDSNRFTRW